MALVVQIIPQGGIEWGAMTQMGPGSAADIQRVVVIH